MAIPSGSGSEVVTRASAILNNTSSKIIDGDAANDIYTVISLSMHNRHASTTASCYIYVNPSAGTSVFLDSDISLPAKATYVWNDKIVLQGTDELVVGCDVDSVHFYVNYIWQDWT